MFSYSYRTLYNTLRSATASLNYAGNKIYKTILKYLLTLIFSNLNNFNILAQILHFLLKFVVLFLKFTFDLNVKINPLF